MQCDFNNKYRKTLIRRKLPTKNIYLCCIPHRSGRYSDIQCLSPQTTELILWFFLLMLPVKTFFVGNLHCLSLSLIESLSRHSPEFIYSRKLPLFRLLGIEAHTGIIGRREICGWTWGNWTLLYCEYGSTSRFCPRGPATCSVSTPEKKVTTKLELISSFYKQEAA